MDPTARFLITFLFVVLLFVVETAAQTEATVLEAGKPVERILKASETHTYKINLAANQFLHVAVHQRETDLFVKLIAPDGKMVSEADYPGDWVGFSNGIEELYALIETTGEYRIEIKDWGNTHAFGHYEIDIIELRPVARSDPALLNAIATTREGFRLSLLEEQPDDKHLYAAIAKHKEAIRSFQAENNTAQEIEVLLQIGMIYVRSFEKPAGSLEYFENAVKVAEKTGDKQRIVKALLFLARGNLESGNWNRVIELCDKAYQLAGTLEPSYWQKYVLFHALRLKGYAYLWDTPQFNNEKAMEVLKSSLGFEKTNPDAGQVAEVLKEIAESYRQLGNSWKALEYLLKALELEERIGGRHIAVTYNNIAGIYMDLNNLDLADYFMQKAYPKYVERERKEPTTWNATQTAIALGNLARVPSARGKTEDAIKKLQEALNIFESKKAEWYIARTLQSIGIEKLKLGKFDEALEYFNRALAIGRKIKNDWLVRNALQNLAGVQFAQGNFKQGLLLDGEVSTMDKHLGNTVPDVTRSGILAKAYVALKQPDKARQILDETIKKGEVLLPQTSGALGQNYFAGFSSAYVNMAEFLISEGNSTDAFSYTERAKSRSLLDVLQNGKLDITKAMTAEEREREKRLKKEMASLNTQISREKDKTRLDDLQKQLETNRREFEDFQIRLYATKPKLKIQRGEMTPISLEEAGTLLTDDKSALLEYVVGEGKSFLFTITKDAAKKVSLKVYPIEIKQKDLAKRTESFRSKMAKGDPDFAQASQDLYDLLLKPAEAELKGKTNLVIVPDQTLWDLPFQVLQPAPGKYLLERSAISYTPSLTALNEMAKKNRGKRFSGATLLAFGNPTVNKATSDQLKKVFMSDPLEPLPEAERLVNSLKNMYGANRSKILVGNEAREETAKTESSKFRIVQFAAHGILNDFSPMYSNIVLAQKQENPNEDGLLEAWEMKDLDLNADMVILSACETARGKVSSGEGVIGMSWALFIAGAPTTVASQWKIDSASTTELMLEFHRQLLSMKKISKAEALRRASLKVMKMPGYKHPFHWAGFVMVGDGS